MASGALELKDGDFHIRAAIVECIERGFRRHRECLPWLYEDSNVNWRPCCRR